jgi:hypothetical protein
VRRCSKKLLSVIALKVREIGGVYWKAFFIFVLQLLKEIFFAAKKV